MLLYRPLLDAYRRTTLLPARRFLLREFASPNLHVEPDEVLANLAEVTSLSIGAEPTRLATEVHLSERSLRLALTTRDPARALGGMWTAHAASRPLAAWMQASAPPKALAEVAGTRLAPVARSLLAVATGDARALTLAALGELGARAFMDLLAQEMASGRSPAPAAFGLARMGTAEAAARLLEGVQARGLETAAPWLGVAVETLALPELSTLVARLARSSTAEARESAAWAIGSFPADQIESLLAHFRTESHPFVRLNLTKSMERSRCDRKLRLLESLCHPSDAEVMRLAAIQCAGSSAEPAAREFLMARLSLGSDEEKAESLQALVQRGDPDSRLRSMARDAAERGTGRLGLIGLLALSLWEPDEAFVRVREIFSHPAANDWYYATFALRYLRTSQTVPLLLKLSRHARGTDLEEFVVSSLCRHLDRPDVLPALSAMVRAGATPVVTHRIMLDLARHLPAELSAAGAQEVRDLLVEKQSPLVTGALLGALGALGERSDLNMITAHLAGPTAAAAVHALELVMEPASIAALEQAALSGPSPGREAAVVALFRLGSPSGVEGLARLAAVPEDPMAAARCFVRIALSVRCVRTVSRLALLYQHLASALKREERGDPASKSTPAEPAQAARRVGLDRALSRARPSVDLDVSVTLGPGPDRDQRSSRVYRQLGKGLDGLTEPVPDRERSLAAYVIMLALFLVGFTLARGLREFLGV